MPIVGLTDQAPSFPEIGHIRKGAPKGDNRPGKDLDYFRVEFNDTDANSETRFKELYGDKPRAIRVMLPYDDIDLFFDAWHEKYTAGKLEHRCDGEIVHYPPSERGQPCTIKNHADAKQRCKPVGRLRVIVEGLDRLGYLTVHTTSKYDLLNLSKNLAAIKQFFGRLTGIPLVLRRVEKNISTPTGKRYKKWLLFFEVSPEWVQPRLAALRESALLEVSGGLALPTGDYAEVDESTGELLVEGEAIEGAPRHTIMHWIDGVNEEGEESEPAFFAYAARMDLDRDAALAALGVKAIREYAGTKPQAAAALKARAKELEAQKKAMQPEPINVLDAAFPRDRDGEPVPTEEPETNEEF